MTRLRPDLCLHSPVGRAARTAPPPFFNATHPMRGTPFASVRAMRISLPLPNVLKHSAEEPARPTTEDLDEYELTPFGRRPKRKRGKKVLLGMSLAGAVAVAVWFLV